MLRFLFTGLAIPLAFAALAGLVSVMLPTRVQQIRGCAVSVPVNAGATGLISLLIAASITWLWELSNMLVVPLCAFPIVLLGWLALASALFIGWTVIGEVVGRIILSRFQMFAPPMIEAVIGAFALGLAVALANYIPCVGWLVNVVTVLLACVGLGAVILTRAGHRAYPPVIIKRSETITD